MIHATRFTVEGSGRFPIDMLRYDSCFPETEFEGSGRIGDDTTIDRREVKLMTYHEHKARNGLTPARWASFGWKIIEVNGRAQ